MRSVTVVNVMSLSWNRICPLSGCRWALIRLTSEVFPAPLEPTSDRNSPSLTMKLTPSQARVSPNCFLRSTVLSRVTSGLLLPAQACSKFRKAAHDAGRQDEHQRDENSPE